MFLRIPFLLIALLLATAPPAHAAKHSAELFLQTGHATYVMSMSFSPDGNRIASGSWDDTVKLWNSVSGELLKTLSAHTAPVSSVSFSPDGKVIASGSADKTVKIWNSATGDLMKTLSGHTAGVTFVSFSPNGKLIASSSADKTVKLWNSVSGELLKTLSAHTSLYSVSFSPDGKRIASGSEDNTVKLWDSVSGELLKILSGHASSVYSVSFSPDGRWIVSGSKDNTVKLWDSTTGNLIKTLSGHAASVNSVSFSPDSKRIVSGSADDTVKVWNSTIGSLIKSISGHAGFVTYVSFSPDGGQIASGSYDNTVKIWDSTTGDLMKTLSYYANPVYSVIFSPDGKQIASGSRDKTVKIWNIETGELLKTLSGHSNSVYSVSFSPDGRLIASGSRDKTVKIWNIETGELLKTLSGHEDFVTYVSFSPDGKQIASGSYDNTIRFWDSTTGELQKTLSDYVNPVYAMGFSPDGKQIASGSNDKTVKIWNTETGKLLKTLLGHEDFVSSLSFSPDGRLIASGSGDKTMKIWNTETGELLKTLSDYADSVSSVSFSPDGKQIASGSRDKTVKIWNTETWELLKTLSSHTDFVTSVSFSPDRRQIASGSRDKTVKIWNTETGVEILSIALLLGNEWIAWQTGQLFYNSSLQGDEYAAIRFDNNISEAYPLKYYRDELKRQDWQNYLSQPQPDIRPKPIRRWWDRLEDKPWKIGSLFFGILMISAFIIVLRRSDPLEISKRFFPKAGFKKVETSDKLLLIHAQTGKITGAVSIWNPENKEAYVSQLKHQINSLMQDKEGVKLYIVYKGLTPPEPKILQHLREERFEVIPLASASLEKALYTQKYVETLKELEEPFIIRKDPYSDSKPIGDPTWFYGRDEMMSRIPAVLAQGQHIGIFGLRKVGKTSLLKQIQQRFVNVPVAYVDCQGHSYSAVAYFEEILQQIYTELKMRKIGTIPKLDKVSSPEDFQKQLMPMFEAWHKKGPEPFMIILDEIDKFFPSREIKDSEAILTEYVKFFKVIRSLAQSYQCLTTLVVAYRPHINRHNLLTPSVGENPMFKSFQEEYLGFLSPADTKSMIQEIGMWKDINWEDDAAERVFYYCGGHPLVCRYFASLACKGGSLKHIDLKRVEFVADDIVKTFRKNDIGNYYKEAVWALLTEKEQEALSVICKSGHEPVLETDIPEELHQSLINAERFGLVKIQDGMVCLTANLFDVWLKRRLGI